MRRFAFVVVSFVISAGCKELNPTYCLLPENAGKDGCPDAPHSGCLGPADCTSTPSTPACAMMSSSSVCVQCTDDAKALCMGTTPLCKNNSCAACALDSECGTDGLCLPNGACAASNTIIHATSNGSMMQDCGSKAKPCNLVAALAGVDATENVIKLDDNGPYTPPPVMNFVMNANVTIDARSSAMGGAVLRLSKKDQPILKINNDKIVTIFSGTIEGAYDSDDAISCGSNATLTLDGTTIDMIGQSAINANSGCKLTLTHVNINNTSLKFQFFPAILTAGASITLSRSSLFSNKGGGVSVTNGTFVIVGNSLSANGDPMSSVGGVSINTTTPDPMNLNRIEFNTISSNASMSGKIPGVDCTVGTGPITIARNNIIWANDNTNTYPPPPTVPQVGGTCKHAYSDISMMSIDVANDGGNNLNMDPVFQTTIYDLHLLSNSPAIMRADPNAKLDGVAAKDFDGDPRIAPADIGFDQRPR